MNLFTVYNDYQDALKELNTTKAYDILIKLSEEKPLFCTHNLFLTMIDQYITFMDEISKDIEEYTRVDQVIILITKCEYLLNDNYLDKEKIMETCIHIEDILDKIMDEENKFILRSQFYLVYFDALYKLNEIEKIINILETYILEYEKYLMSTRGQLTHEEDVIISESNLLFLYKDIFKYILLSHYRLEYKIDLMDKNYQRIYSFLINYLSAFKSIENLKSMGDILSAIIYHIPSSTNGNLDMNAFMVLVNQVIETLEQLNDEHYMAVFYKLKGDSEISLNEIENAYSSYELSINTSLNNNNISHALYVYENGLIQNIPDPEKILKLYEDLKRILEERKDEYSIITLYDITISYLFKNGLNNKVESYLEDYYKLVNKLKASKESYYSHKLNHILNLKDNDEKLKGLFSLIKVLKKDNYHRLTLKCFRAMGSVYKVLGKSSKAVRIYKKMGKYFKQMKRYKEYFLSLKSLWILEYALLNIKSMDKTFKKMLKLVTKKEIIPSWFLVKYYVFYINILEKIDQKRIYVNFHHKLFNDIVKNMDLEDLVLEKRISLSYHLYKVRKKALSLKYLRLIDKKIDKMIINDPSKAFLFIFKYPVVYKLIINIYLKRKDYDKALYYLDKSKAIQNVFYKTTNNSEIKDRKELNQRSKKDLIEEKNKLELSRVDFPYEVHTPRLNEVTGLLKDNDAILIFYILYKKKNKSKIYCILLQRDIPLKIFPVCKIDEDESLFESINKMKQLLNTEIDKSTIAQRKLLNLSHSIYELLFKNIRCELLNGVDKLYILPEGDLNALPFHLLYDIEEVKYLIERYNITYYLSLESFYKKKLKADIYTITDQDKISAFIDPESDLKYTHLEKDILMDLRKDISLFVEDEVTRANFVSGVGNSEIIHYAGHTTFDKDYPMLSYLSLYDTKFYTFDFYPLELKKLKLFVFSSCESGKIYSDVTNKVIGLMRGLLVSSNPVILTSLWSVSDESTGVFMKFFYTKILSEGKSIDTAYKESMLELKDKYPYPFNWAPFVLYNA